MKFREFVGEPKAKEIKKAVKNRPKLYEYTIGFGIGKKNLKRVFDYIRSWYFRYKVPFESINPYLTVFKAVGMELQNSIIVGELNQIRKQNFKKGKIIVLRQDKDYICIEYEPLVFLGEIEESLKNLFLDVTEKTCYVKLLSTDVGSLQENLYYDMFYAMPEIPKIYPGGIGVLSRRI